MLVSDQDLAAPPASVPSLHPEEGEELVVRTRLLAPKIRPLVINRPRVAAMLAKVLHYPLTVIKAEAGYGKTTAVAAFLARTGLPHFWYSVGDTEPNPRLFLLHLLESLRRVFPAVGQLAVERLALDERSPRHFSAAVDSLSNELLDQLHVDTVLVLDDYDRVNTSEVNAVTERLIETMPPLMHVVITARTMPSLRSRTRWRASGELLDIARADLAFSADEVVALFSQHSARPPSADVAGAIAAETEGWPIALQMLSASAASTQAETLDNLLQRIPGPAELLFDYLADEVFLRQTPEIRRFLGESASLRTLDREACERTLGIEGAEAVLRYLEDSSLFVTSHTSVRYHNLFRDFLLRRSGVPRERRVELHQRAAAWFQHKGNDEEAVYHLLAAEEFETAADLLSRIADRMAASGRHQALGSWLDQLPADVLARSPALLLARGDARRLTSRYAEALPAYQAARDLFRQCGDVSGEVLAIQGQALVYLDTVQPARAEPLLREALHKTRSGNRIDRAGLFLLSAENRLNAGELRHAERLFRAVHRVLHGNDAHVVDPRLLLRQGRFAEAVAVLEANQRAESDPAGRGRAPRSHREATALLAWIQAMTGDATAARQHALQSLELGRSLGSPMIECISHARLGFGWLSGHDFDPVRALTHFTDALRAAEAPAVPRFRVEPLLGLIIVYGLDGKADDAERAACEAVAILVDAGDRYLQGVVCVASGAALVLARRPHARQWLDDAVRLACASGDRYTPCVARLWLAIHHSRFGDVAQARAHFLDALAQSKQLGYESLFLGMPLLTPRDNQVWRGLLRRAQADRELGEYAATLARGLDAAEARTTAAGPESLASAPLYVQTLGPLRVWRKGQEIERAAWGREKALHLFEYLVSHRETAVHREQVLEALWPDSPRATAATGLRVALSALRHALEPERETRADSQFVRRDADTIRLARESGVRVDADEFSRRLKLARTLEAENIEVAIARYESALALYHGEFLSEDRYSDWVEPERQSRRSEFVGNAERLSGLLLRAGETERAARWAETILQHDPLWEAAYALLMEAHWRQGNRALAVRTYDRCRKRLRDALGVEPSTRTTALLQLISRSDVPEVGGANGG